MPRVIGIDPGTVTIDVCGIDNGRVFLDRTLPTEEALGETSTLVGLLESAAPLDLVVGPSGYGLPLTAARDLTEADLRLAFLAAESETGGIGGLRSFVRMLGRLPLPVVLTPGVVHLSSVPTHRKINRVDMGTADKVCVAALAVHDQAARRGCTARDTAFILLELGGAFTAAIAVESGRIVDGIGGTSGPLGIRAAGALDGEVAYLAGQVTKHVLFRGGAAAVAGDPRTTVETLAREGVASSRGDDRARPVAVAWSAYFESALKAIASLVVSAADATEIVLSGRGALIDSVHTEFARALSRIVPGRAVHVLRGFAAEAKQAAQGAALIADGLAGGPSADLVETLGIRTASGTVLDHLHVIDAAAARRRLGL